VTRQGGGWTALLVLATASVFACTLLLVRYPASNAPLSNLLSADDSLRPGEFHAVLLLQPADCASRMETLYALTPGRRAHGITATALIIGSNAEARQAMRGLRSRGIQLPVRNRRSAPRVLQTLGYTHTPFVVVFDSAGRVRLAAPAPGSPAELRQFEGALAALSGINPLS
jgi:hypothetical protein